MIKNTILLSTLLLAGCAKADLALQDAAKHAEQDKIRLAVEAEVAKYKLVGGSVTAFKEGQIIYSDAFGLATKPGTQMTPGTPSMLASTTKPITAVAILQLHERGKLSIDDPLGKFMPEVPDDWKSLKLRYLLSHTSGILDYSKYPDFMSLYGKDLSRREVFEHMFAKPLQFKPGENMEYSNTAYHLLGLVVEKASGQAFNDYLQASICKPAGMTSTVLAKPKSAVQNLATGYDAKGEVTAYASPAWSFTAGAVASSSEDMARFMMAIEAGKLLKPETVNLMVTPTKLTNGEEGRLANAMNMRYGYGWLITAINGSPGYLHAGGRPGASTFILYMPKEKYGIAVLVNQTDGRAMEIAQAVTKVALGQAADRSDG